MNDLTDRQRDVYHAIARLMRERGYPPTQREIMEETGLKSPQSVTDYLVQLRRKGYLELGAGPRAIRLLGPVCTYCGGTH